MWKKNSAVEQRPVPVIEMEQALCQAASENRKRMNAMN
jgi:hypothetical protein